MKIKGEKNKKMKENLKINLRKVYMMSLKISIRHIIYIRA